MSRRELIRNIVHFGSGEALARVGSIAVMILLGHRYGVLVLGVYALAVGVSAYTVPLIDFGLKHIGARLIAQYPEYGQEIVYRIQRRRRFMAGVLIPLLFAYSFSARLSTESRDFVLVFSLTSTLYALSLDWVAWGKEHLQLVGVFRAFIPLSILVAVSVAPVKGGTVLWWAAAGNLLGYILQAVVFREWWRRQDRRLRDTGNPTAIAVIESSLAWRGTVVMGSAWLAQTAFNSIDTLMLGVISGPEQVGLYSSAYRILSQILITYYMVILPLYPKLARVRPERRMFLIRPSILLGLFGIGTTLAIVVGSLRKELLVIVFGHSFVSAAVLVSILVWAVPLDFITSYLNNAYIAWGMERMLLICIAIAAGINIALNLAFLPRFGAMAAAINTLAAYLVYLVGLILMRRYAQSAPQVAAIAPAE
jgi:O-antigen/teichoic acid export membrane protein